MLHNEFHDYGFQNFFNIEVFPKWLAVCIDNLNDAIVITEAEPIDEPGPRIVWANKVFFTRNGYAPNELIGKNPRILQGPLTDRKTLNKIRAALEQWQPIRAETLNYRKDGTTYWNEFEIVPIGNETGWFTHWISVQRDVTERKLMENKLAELASVDFLTGILNRRSFIISLNEEIDRLNRGYIQSLAVLMIDLDYFKRINDTYGHAAGDAVLRHFATLGNNCLRKTDTIGRIGGEEFAMVLPNTDIITAEPLAARLMKQVTQNPAHFNGSMIEFSISLGISVMDSSLLQTADEILINADRALYQAKGEGRNCFRVYKA